MTIGEILSKTGRYPSLVMGCGATIAATACALLRGEMEWVPASICLLFALVTQLMGNFYYYYADASDGLGESIDDSIFSRNADTNLVKIICRASYMACLIISITLGLAMLTMAGWWTLVPAVIIYGLIYLNYTTPALLSARPYGFIIPFLLFGIISIGPAALLQVGHDNTNPFAWYYLAPIVFSSVAMGFLAANALLVYNYGHVKHDIENCRDTFTVKYGKPATRFLVGLFGVLYFALIAVFVFTQPIRSPWVSFCVALIPFAINCWVTYKLDDPNLSEGSCLNLTRICMANYVLSAILMLIVSIVLGDPDKSTQLMF